jgi:transposase
MTTHPHWATKHKRKGTELRLIKGKYYLYEVSSVWDKEKKRSKKISGKLLGRITEDNGFVESDKAKLRNRELVVSKLTVKEYGITALIDSNFQDYIVLLKKYFPNHWQVIVSLTYCRLVYHSPLKNIEHHYYHSYLSELYPNLLVSPKSLTSVMREIGVQRNQITLFFKEFSKANDNILFDGTDLLSSSKKMDITKFSKSKKGTFHSLANIMFVFSIGLQLPIYYRIIPGNIKDVKSFKLCLEESQIKDAVIIADKGFYSRQNILQLKEEQLNFIIPLRRNNKCISYENLKVFNKQSFEGFFKYEGRIIWYYTIPCDEEKINVYLDEELKAEEVKDFLNRIETLPEKYDIETFYEKQYTFGTIALLYNEQKSSEEIFLNYKARGKVEGMIDVFKNIMEADNSYMQNEQALEAWMFINYIALHWYYKIFHLLVANKLNQKYAPMDLIMQLKEIRKVKINEQWHNAEVTAKTKALLDLLNIHIT